MHKTVNERVALYLVKIRRFIRLDSQAIRAKLLSQLEALFSLAFSIEKGEVKRFRVDQGKMYGVTPQQLARRKDFAEIDKLLQAGYV